MNDSIIDSKYPWYASVKKFTFEGDQEPFDWAMDELEYEIGNLGNDHYYICTAVKDSTGVIELDPAKYLPELDQYRDMITSTAWVE